uniref:lysogenization protein HflD n=1 Tax=Candidatus Vondammii sp. HM_W22 TaxID=2687299 RepID=UPI001F144090|nr:DUF489 family protein [Candidatus Vondammii sp. HM_W22]
MKTDRDRCIAIAGVFQAAELASQIAHRGMADSLAVETSIHSLFQTDADTVSEVYGGILGIATGLNAMAARLEGGDLKEVNTIRYVVALLNLERKLSKKREMLKQVSKGISLATERLSHFNLPHSNIIAQLADIYASTVSTFAKPRKCQPHPRSCYWQACAQPCCGDNVAEAVSRSFLLESIC